MDRPPSAVCASPAAPGSNLGSCSTGQPPSASPEPPGCGPGSLLRQAPERSKPLFEQTFAMALDEGPAFSEKSSETPAPSRKPALRV
jgi:hypothetical protein